MKDSDTLLNEILKDIDQYAIANPRERQELKEKLARKIQSYGCAMANETVEFNEQWGLGG